MLDCSNGCTPFFFGWLTVKYFLNTGGKKKKTRDITLSTKVCVVKAMVFPVVMYGCESWTIRRLSAEELMLLNCGVGEDS